MSVFPKKRSTIQPRSVRHAVRAVEKRQRFQFKKRLFLNLSSFILLLSILIWGWQKLCDPYFLPLHTIRVDGNYAHLSKKLLRQNVEPFLSQGFLKVNTTLLKERLQELPWVQSVTIWRVWPDTLRIHLEEHQAMARWGQAALLDTQGDIFYVAPQEIPTQLPVLEGPNGQQKAVLQSYRDMTTLLAPLRLKVSALSLTARHAWQLRLNNGMMLILGRDKPLQRLQRFVKAYPHLFEAQDKKVAYVDLRYAHGLAVKWVNVY